MKLTYLTFLLTQLKFSLKNNKGNTGNRLFSIIKLPARLRSRRGKSNPRSAQPDAEIRLINTCQSCHNSIKLTLTAPARRRLAARG